MGTGFTIVQPITMLSYYRQAAVKNWLIVYSKAGCLVDGKPVKVNYLYHLADTVRLSDDVGEMQRP